MGGTRTAIACGCALIAATALLPGCNASSGGDSGGRAACSGGQVQSCPCADGTMATRSCRTDGLGYLACACPIAGGMAPGTTMFAQMPMAGTMSTLPTLPVTGAAGTTPPPPPPVAGMAGITPPVAGVGGAPLAGMSGGGGVGGSSGAGSGGAAGMMTGMGGSTSSDDLEEVRQICVDYINMYRATLSLPALTRGTAAQETCSDMGAKTDGDSGVAHGSAGMCQGLGGQAKSSGQPPLQWYVFYFYP